MQYLDPPSFMLLIPCIFLQSNLTKYSLWQVSDCYIFRYQVAILRESYGRKELQLQLQLQQVNQLTGVLDLWFFIFFAWGLQPGTETCSNLIFVTNCISLSVFAIWSIVWSSPARFPLHCPVLNNFLIYPNTLVPSVINQAQTHSFFRWFIPVVFDVYK